MAKRRTGRRSVDGFELVIDRETSARLGRVRQKGTKPELAVRRMVRELGHFYRVLNRDLAGSPDLANRSRRWAIFVHGCFWHHHARCRRATVPTRNRSFWTAKFADNRRRDRAKIVALRALGFSVVVIWECETIEAPRLRRKLSAMQHPGE